jgi:hypothetical protein
MQSQKKLIITVGPQGSGNHIFARILSMHPSVFGWKSLKNHYFLKHSFEPFAEYFIYPQLMTPDFFDKDYSLFVSNSSFPVGFQGVFHNPKILEFATRAKSFGIDVQIAVIIRDEDIVRTQQLRTRKKTTVDAAKQYINDVLIPSEFPVHFLSLETFFSLKQTYLKYISKILNFPIDYENPEILTFIEESPNKKYITPIEKYWLDEWNHQGIALEDFLDTKVQQNRLIVNQRKIHPYE